MNDSLVRIPSAEKYILLILVKTMTFSALFRMKTRVSHRYFVTECLPKVFLILTCRRTLQTSFSLTFFVNVTTLTLF